MNDAHWLAPIAVRVTMTVSHMCAAIEYDDSEVARGTYEEQINPICEVLHGTWLEMYQEEQLWGWNIFNTRLSGWTGFPVALSPVTASVVRKAQFHI